MGFHQCIRTFNFANRQIKIAEKNDKNIELELFVLIPLVCLFLSGRLRQVLL